MRKYVYMAIVLAICIWGINTVTIKASDLNKNEEYMSIDDFEINDSIKTLEKNGYRDLNFRHILDDIMSGNVLDVIKECSNVVYQKTVGDFTMVEKALGNLLLIVILSAFFTNFANVFSNDGISSTGFYICYLIVTTMLMTLFENFCLIATDFVRLLLEFLCGIVPAYFLSVAITGQVAAAGFYQLTLVIISVAQFIFLRVLVPMIKVYVTINLINNISKEDFLSKTSDLLKNAIAFINKTVVGIVVGLNIIQALILPAVDGVKNNAIRKVVGALPVVGDGSDAVCGILLGSVNLIKNTIGGFAIIVIIMLCGVPFIKIQLYSISMQIAQAVVQPVADKRMINSISCVVMGIKMLAKVIIGASMLFIISIAIICIVTGKE